MTTSDLLRESLRNRSPEDISPDDEADLAPEEEEEPDEEDDPEDPEDWEPEEPDDEASVTTWIETGDEEIWLSPTEAVATGIWKVPVPFGIRMYV